MPKKIIPVSSPYITERDARFVYNTIKSGWVSSSGKNLKKFSIKNIVK